MTHRIRYAAAAVGLLAGIAPPPRAQAQTPDALINKLIQKGVLTVQEASDLKAETNKDAAKASPAKTGLPDWVSALKFSGDFRARYEGHYVDNPAFVDRHRFRYRLRLGALATLRDDFELGFRLGSGDPVSGFGNNTGNPLSASSSFQDNASRKFIYVDLAYAKWSPLHTADWGGSLTFGKMENPFLASYNVFDPDYNPEGLAAQLTYALSPEQALKLSLGGFVLDEIPGSSHDPLLGGAQLRWDAKWSKPISTSLGFGVFGIRSREGLANGNVPNVNRGNTRDASGAPVYSFTPVVGDGSVTCRLDSFPAYTGVFPIKIGGEYLENPVAPEQNRAWMVGVTFGKAGRKGLWELSYQYRYLGADSWYEELPDDDYGAYYQAQQPNAGFASVGAGFGGGTNLRGHVAKLSYSPLDSLILSVTYYDAELILASPLGSNSAAHHLLVDLVWRF